MKRALQPFNEARRIAALRSYGILDTPSDSILDNITQTAANVCGTPIALISLIDSKRQWFKSSVGMSVRETHRDLAFCSHAILEPGQLMEVENATLDERFHDNPLVTGEPMIRFYAGQPLVTADGYPLGTLCVINDKPLRLSHSQQDALHRLAQIVIDLFTEREKSKSSANDDTYEQLEKHSTLITVPNQLSANLPTSESNILEAFKQRRHHKMIGKHHRVVDTLTSILSSAVEYDLHIEPVRLVNYIDFYCTYLECTHLHSLPSKDECLDGNAVPATFLQFIFNQTLLNEVALVITLETGEQLAAPAAVVHKIT